MPADRFAITEEDLRAEAPGVWPTAIVVGDSRFGTVFWRSGNRSAQVTAQPFYWITPNSDPSGASGAWQFELPKTLPAYNVLGSYGSPGLGPVSLKTSQYDSTYIDAVNGDDSREGYNPATAVRTMARAAALTDFASRSAIVLLTDVPVPDVHRWITSSVIQFAGRSYATGSPVPALRKLIFSPGATNNLDSCAALHFDYAERVFFKTVDFVMPHTSKAQSSILRCDPPGEIVLNGCHLTPPVSGTACLFDSPARYPHAHVIGTTVQSGRSMRGRYFKGLPATYDPRVANPNTTITKAMNS